MAETLLMKLFDQIMKISTTIDEIKRKKEVKNVDYSSFFYAMKHLNKKTRFIALEELFQKSKVTKNEIIRSGIIPHKNFNKLLKNHNYFIGSNDCLAICFINSFDKNKLGFTFEDFLSIFRIKESEVGLFRKDSIDCNEYFDNEELIFSIYMNCVLFKDLNQIILKLLEIDKNLKYLCLQLTEDNQDEISYVKLNDLYESNNKSLEYQNYIFIANELNFYDKYYLESNEISNTIKTDCLISYLERVRMAFKNGYLASDEDEFLETADNPKKLLYGGELSRGLSLAYYKATIPSQMKVRIRKANISEDRIIKYEPENHIPNLNFKMLEKYTQIKNSPKIRTLKINNETPKTSREGSRSHSRNRIFDLKKTRKPSHSNRIIHTTNTFQNKETESEDINSEKYQYRDLQIDTPRYGRTESSEFERLSRDLPSPRETFGSPNETMITIKNDKPDNYSDYLKLKMIKSRYIQEKNEKAVVYLEKSLSKSRGRNISKRPIF